MNGAELAVWEKIQSVGYAEWHEGILKEVEEECVKQLEKWGVQNHPDGTGPDASVYGIKFGQMAQRLKELNDHYASDAGIMVDAETGAYVPAEPLWSLILLEEVFEALAETDPGELRAELVQVAAVVASWIEHLDRVNG